MIPDVIDRRLTTQMAAQRLGISDRQCRRLLARYREDGPLGMTSRRRGKSSNNQLPQGLAAYALNIIRERYNDFGPTLACEKLAEVHGVHISKETVRKLMTQASLWVPRKQRAPKIQQPRYRRACAGELIQIDGCDHHWFENRATRGYIEMHGKPLALYSDKASVFRINNKNATGGEGETQFGRAMHELNIQTICAETSAAKGRVERAHLTLQDRLVKELRLQGISTMESANAFAEEFMNDYNRRFSKAPRQEFDVHRELDVDDDLDMVFTWREARRVSKSLTVQYDKVLYLIEDNEFSRRAIGKYIDVWHYPDGHKELRLNGVSLPYSTYDKLSEIDQGAIVDNKRLGRALEMAQLVQAERDNNRSQSVPSGDGPSRRRKAPTTKKSQRSFDQDDMFNALVKLQTRAEEIFGERNQK
ncbi:helix-turn-helix domain-containing protein [Escherichia coli]|uniref:helix-turn-helix domain-containing protein n=1 Tax=Escherichia coli TaxID=562 RepID=UPI0024AF1AE4|nr:helix-turn-helix domain-containing protein [Escherichia coli]EDZ3588360.1 helix-turn-helix domain-containing protein [Salmonella enterica subsp. enterica serovar Wagenia]MDI7036731.1 ISNCY family transposase [Escherichia coli]MDI7046334.1 ISNCY family transposase [Escherichia coli]